MSDSYEFDVACEFPEKPGEPKKALLRLYVTSKKASRQHVQEVAKALMNLAIAATGDPEAKPGLKMAVINYQNALEGLGRK